MAIRQASPGGTSAANPFSGGSAPAGTTSLARRFSVELPNGQIVNVSSQAEVDALQAAYAPSTTKIGGSSSSSGGVAGFVEAAGDGLEAVGSFLAGRQYSNELQDYQDAQDRLQTARDQLATALASSGGASSPAAGQATLAAIDAMLDTQDAAVRVLNTQITAVDLAAGGAGARLVGRFLGGGMGVGGGNGMGTALAVGAAGLGLGLLASSNNNSNSTSRRRR